MPLNAKRMPSIMKTLLYAVLSLFLVIGVIAFPEHALQASSSSLNIWWEIIFPILLPFLILTEICAGFGFFLFIGVLLQPMIGLLFRLPANAAPVFVAGFISGQPAGARAAAKMRKMQVISRHDGERLLALAQLCSPILMVNIIAFGFFDSATLGYLLTAVQVLSILICGWLLGLRREQGTVHPPSIHQPRLGLWRQALIAMEQEQQKDGRKIGQIFGESVLLAVEQLMKIGGIMMIFAVIAKLLVLLLLMQPIIPLDGWFESHWIELGRSMLIGFFEIHLGAFALSQLNAVTPFSLFLLLNLLLAWGGLASHAQLQVMLQSCDLRYRYFFKARVLHALITLPSACIVWLLTNPILDLPASLPAVQSSGVQVSLEAAWHNRWNHLIFAIFSGVGLLVCIAIVIRWFHWKNHLR